MFNEQKYSIEPRYLDVRNAAIYLSVSESSVYKMIEKGKIKFIKWNERTEAKLDRRKVLLDRIQLDKLMQKYTQERLQKKEGEDGLDIHAKRTS